MTGMRRATVAVAATVVLSGLAGAAAGCAGSAGSAGSSGSGEGGGATAAGKSLRPAASPSALGKSAALGFGGVSRSAGSANGAAHQAGAARADISVPVPSAVIKTASLDLRVAHGRFGDAMNAATDVALRFGGYVSRRTSFGTKVHDGTIVLRVPAGRFDPARAAVERLGRPTNEVVSGRDVTRQLVNLGARL